MSEPSTSLPNSSHNNPSTYLTPERVRQVELNRLKAKARQREQDASTVASSVRNANEKRPLSVVPAVSSSPTASLKKPGSEKLQRDNRLGKYFDYDLSKMVNSKGGFLVEDDKEADDDLKAKERGRERQRAMQNLDPRVCTFSVNYSLDETISLDPSRNPKCHDCGSVDIDQLYRKVFRCLVCNKCKNEKVEKYSLLTKTECKEDYLLTDSELRDEEVLPHMLKANPHKSTFANMMLYCRYQVEEFAWKKWGSPEALDTEWERRSAEKKKKKNKKFEQGLQELRKRTREGVWQKRKDAEHKHEFSETTTNEDGVDVQVCRECDFMIEVEEF
ncbi:hydrophilic protein [Multifurca ochricompacta]|uniref:DNA repair protein RAD14 n=1 Tax=Multifurca ochricompacta TaxID=376703 RepID=A0AAD4MCD1_9AGAM|nr:hydrophilic protein [Multifurca ochricompacta]